MSGFSAPQAAHVFMRRVYEPGCRHRPSCDNGGRGRGRRRALLAHAAELERRDEARRTGARDRRDLLERARRCRSRARGEIARGARAAFPAELDGRSRAAGTRPSAEADALAQLELAESRLAGLETARRAASRRDRPRAKRGVDRERPARRRAARSSSASHALEQRAARGGAVPRGGGRGASRRLRQRSPTEIRAFERVTEAARATPGRRSPSSRSGGRASARRCSSPAARSRPSASASSSRRTRSARRSSARAARGVERRRRPPQARGAPRLSCA